MLRKRFVTLLTFVDGVLFRTKEFHPDYRYTLNFVDAWSVDEIVVLDVTRPAQGERENFLKVVESFAKRCFVPLSAGGGVRSIDDVKRLLAAGADKVTVNTGAFEQLELITEIASAYGAQCVVVSMDVKRDEDGNYEVYSTFGSCPTGWAPADWAREAERRGAGEILVTSIDRDGSLSGYDLELCRTVAQAVSVPVLIAGGAGNWKHFVEGFTKGHADAVCATNIYHFTETSIYSAKLHLGKANVCVRV